MRLYSFDIFDCLSFHILLLFTQETVNEKLWNAMDGDKDGKIRMHDVDLVMARYKKSLPRLVQKMGDQREK